MNHRHCFALLAAIVATSASGAAIADEPFAYRVCTILGEPFLSNVSYRGGEGGGCTWGLVNPDGETRQNERLQVHATLSLSKEQLASAANMMLLAYKEAAAKGGSFLEPWPACEGGWQIRSNLKPDRPVHSGFYTCGTSFVEVETQGPESTRQFEYVGRQMTGLVR